MRIKVFKAADLKEAMAMVKDELGSNAVILHTKRYREGGFLGYMSKDVVEVTAAIDDEPQPKKIIERTKRSPRLKPQSVPMVARPKNVVAKYKTIEPLNIEEKNEPREEGMPRTTVTAVQTYAEPNLINIPPKRVVAQMRPVQNPIMEEELPKAQAKENLPKEVPSQTIEKDDKISVLEKELAEMKAILKNVMQTNANPNIKTLQDVLREHDVDDEVIADMMKRMTGAGLIADGTSDEAKTSLLEYLKKTFQFSEGISLKNGQTNIVALIGTTGVGKTTTLAKIAARFVLEKGISAALITADTYRISAVDQLKTYSDIIGLPLEIVYSPAELRTAIKKFRNKQLILIDTAGRSQNNKFQMKELIEFLQIEPTIEKHLVLSATTKDKDIVRIIDKFSPCKPDRVIFTKLDETSSIGSLLSILFEKKLALSYLTNGQSVPDDIVPAKAEVLAKLLLE